MIKIAELFILLIFSYQLSYSQDNAIDNATYHFTLDNITFRGPGADTLKAYIANAQFFLIGEEHNMAELQNFTKAIIPFLKDEGYRNLALEIGATAAKKLVALDKAGIPLLDFNSRYYNCIRGTPFGFFDGKEEETFLNQAIIKGFNIWGIDFENYNSSLFFLDELYDHSSKNETIKIKYDAAYQFMIDEYAKDQTIKNYQLCDVFLNSKEINSFIKAVPVNSETKPLIDNQLKSWRIYDQESKNNWYPRVVNMKENFINYYQQQAKKEKLPKVFLKLGAVHTARGTSNSGFQEVGNTLYEMANINCTKSFSVISFARFRIDEKGQVKDLLEPEDKELLKYTDRNSWSLIDLKKLERDASIGKIKLSKATLDYAKRYDMMLIPPSTKKMIPNYK